MSFYLTLLGILFVYYNIWFIISLACRRNDVADIAWGLGGVLLAWSGLFLSGNYEERQWLVTTLITLWGLRLSWYIHVRNRKKREDSRYQEWRKVWGSWFALRSYFQVYLLQGLLLFVILIPTLYIQAESYSTLRLRDLIGTLIWLIGFVFEGVGDAQLRNFIKDEKNKGKLMTTGLWRYTRHPNYFGEVVMWWGIWVISGSVTGAYWLLVSPFLISYLILKVSGIPLLEKKYAHHPDFAGYKARTSMIIPWFPG